MTKTEASTVIAFHHQWLGTIPTRASVLRPCVLSMRYAQAVVMDADAAKKTKISLEAILKQYAESFASKTYAEENDDLDVLMEVFGISPALKRENRQYWGRELGMCWQLVVTRVFENCRSADFGPGYRSGLDEMSDLMLKKIAIDTKYRIGSGDSGTLKKFKQYGKVLRGNGFDPVLLILRSDNLPAAIQACKGGGWRILVGDASFQFIKKESGFDLYAYLKRAAKRHDIKRSPTTPLIEESGDADG